MKYELKQRTTDHGLRTSDVGPRTSDFGRRTLNLGLFVLLCLSFAAAQNASDYFPSKTGNTWRYQRFSLDTLQNQILVSKTIVTDSLIGTMQIKGSPAFVLISGKKPAYDTTFVNVQGSTIAEYLIGYPRITSQLPVDSLGLGFVWGYLNSVFPVVPKYEKIY